MPERPYSEYAERNGGPILEVLQYEFAASTTVLEIGSGTGQHAVRFASAMPHLQWQASDRANSDLVWWTDASVPKNVLPPLTLDVLTDAGPNGAWDAVFSANTAHIMSLAAVQKMFALVGRVLRDGGVFCLYGPFRQGGAFNTESNASFDRALRSRDPDMGIRDLESLDEIGTRHCLFRTRLYTMPANNHMAIWIKGSE
jgi:SAM-dependent methyltransferase